MVMVEVVLNNLSVHNLTDEQREFRDELLEILVEHIDDVAVTVRAKILQQWARWVFIITLIEYICVLHLFSIIILLIDYFFVKFSEGIGNTFEISRDSSGESCRSSF